MDLNNCRKTNLTGKVALITGSAAGLGLAIAKRLLKEGATVLLNDIDPVRLKDTFTRLSRQYKNLYSYPCDITEKEKVEDMAGFLIKKTSKIDILVNNAGITSDSFFHKMEDSSFDRVIKVNLYGTYNCTRALIGHMREAGYGRIINIASVVGISGNIGQANYSASKAAVIGLTKSLALESALKSITVNVIAPGYIVTEMTGKIPDKVVEKVMAKIPMARFGKPEDIASITAYLASEEAGYITGQVISVNGGYLT